MIPEKDWQWFGLAGHFICGQWCRFHLCTLVGKYVVSTVGQYVHPSKSQGSESKERKWLSENPNGERIGCGRFYETMVFKLKKRCDDAECDCGGHPLITPRELDAQGANTQREARENHLAMCSKWAGK